MEELTGLMVAWKSAYSPKETAPSDGLVNWHDRWLWPTLHRLNIQLHVWAKCTGGSHVPPRPAPPVTDEASFTRLLGEVSPRSEPARLLGPADPLDAAAADAVLLSGDAVSLLPDDPLSPFRYRDRWYGIPDAGLDGLWQPVLDDRGAQLDLMLSRLNLASSPKSGST